MLVYVGNVPCLSMFAISVVALCTENCMLSAVWLTRIPDLVTL